MNPVEGLKIEAMMGVGLLRGWAWCGLEWWLSEGAGVVGLGIGMGIS